MKANLSDEEALELLKEISEGNEESLHKLYQSLNSMVYFYVYKFIKNDYFAEEIMIKTFTEVWKNARTFKEKSKVTTWIIGIAKNITAKEIKKMKKFENFISYYSLYYIEKITYDNFPDRKDFIKKCMNKLSSKHKEVLDMFFFCEMSYTDIAQKLGISINTVKSRIFYAKRRLKFVLEKTGIENI